MSRDSQRDLQGGIEELSARAASIAEAIAALKAKRPTQSSPDEIVAMLDAIPDMRDALATEDETELAEIFDAFDVTATYDKPTARLELAATVRADLVTNQEKNDRPRGRSLNSVIAGERSAAISDRRIPVAVVVRWLR